MTRQRLSKKFSWTRHQASRYRKSVARRISDPWVDEIGYGAAPVPGRLLAASKVRRGGA